MAKLNDVVWIKKDGQVESSAANLSTAKTLLDSTGCGFCLAKFSQVTVHLGTGAVHSCHHPRTHVVPVEEINADPAALFNSSHLKQARREMLAGQRPSECDYCWRIEDGGGNSDRFYKSIEPWALPKHDSILERGPDATYYPSYLEVDFSNACNFACTYCGPEFSSSWVDELKRNGPVKVLDGTSKVQWIQGWQSLDDLTYKNREHNPYLEAFWKWFPEAYKHLNVYRITGGEPLLSKETFRSMDWFISNPNPNLEFSINSNLGVPDKLWDQFISKITELLAARAVKKFTVFTSVDGWGKAAEYARPGLDFELFKRRYEQLLQLGNVRAVIMCTFNIFSVTTIKELLEWQLTLKKRYNPCNHLAGLEEMTGFQFTDDTPYALRKQVNPDHYATVGIDIPYLRSPECLDARYVDRALIQRFLLPALNFMVENTCNYTWNAHQGFETYETDKFKRVVTDLLHTRSTDAVDEKTALNRAKFYDFVQDIDRRYNRMFVDCFPEMVSFLETCRISRNDS